ncbi:helicase associated domain-containing protein [Streptomyces celluloflavus]|uniref:helicase associated domain-containing protein n=1 Tax=Streptomyces celluloflavus TaxID=58344 RepID=UPI00367F0A0E
MLLSLPVVSPLLDAAFTGTGVLPEFVLARSGAAARPAEREADFATALGYARSYHAIHGTLAAAIDTVHDGFPLGRWLVRTRRQARQGHLSAATSQALTAIAPWWNPPWPHTWQRTYQQTKLAHHTGQPLPSPLQKWTDRQRTRWNTLHPDQQHLLTSIGIRPG